MKYLGKNGLRVEDDGVWHEGNFDPDSKVDNSRVLTDVPANAKFTDTIYTHPSTHPASMITESASRRFVSDTEKASWNSKQDALGYTPVNKAGDTMTGDLKVNGNVVAGTEYIVGYNGTSESLQRFKFKYNGSTGYLELWRYSNNTGWTLCATFPNRNTGSGGLTVEGKAVAFADDVNTALANKVDNSRVLTDVPLNAKFTDTVYVHPSSHKATMIEQDINHRFVTDAEKASWNSKWDYDEDTIKLVKVNSAINADTVNGKTVNESVPANAKFTDTITSINGKTGVITKADIVALGIPAQDTNTTYSEISTAEIDAGTSSTLRTITGRRVKYILDKVQEWIDSVTKADIGLGNVDNVKQASKTEFDAHNNDNTKHITNTERNNWNNKAEISDIPTKVSQLENDKNYVTQEDLGSAGYGDMVRSVYDTNNNGIVDNAEKVNGFTVGTNVPANAKFTDTIYTHPSTHPASMITGLHSVATSGIADKLSIVDTRSVDSPPSYYFGLGRNMHWEFKYRTSVGNPPTNASASGTYAFILTITGWQNNTGGYPVQISVGGKNLAIRQGISTTAWGSWYVIANVDDVPTKLSQLTKDVNFDERYYTETESDAKYESKIHIGTTPPSDDTVSWIDTSI